MKVVVGTGNPVKVAAVRRAFSRLGIECEVLGVRTVTSVGPQPVGLRTTVRGAVERALGALRSSESDYGVGIEAGFVEVRVFNRKDFSPADEEKFRAYLFARKR